MWNLSFKDSSFTIFRPNVLCSGFLHHRQIVFPSSSLFFDGRSEDQIVPLQIVFSFFRSDHASSNRLFVLPLQIRSCLFKSFFLCSSSNLMFFKYKIESLRLEIYVTSSTNSPIGNRVFNPRVLDWNRAYKTRDVSLQHSFKPILTYDILPPHCASLHILSQNTHDTKRLHSTKE